MNLLYTILLSPKMKDKWNEMYVEYILEFIEVKRERKWFAQFPADGVSI